MNVIAGLLLIVAVIVFVFLALPMAISAAWGLAGWMRKRRLRRGIQTIEDMLRERS